MPQVFNLQRLAVLTTALARSPPDPELIFEAMKDRVHHPYRMPLVSSRLSQPSSFSPLHHSCSITSNRVADQQIPGLPKILTSVTPSTHPGLLGICLSGAGPTILALATDNFDAIAGEIVKIFKEVEVEVDWEVLEVDERGSWVEEL